MFWKKGVLRNSTKMTGKHLCQSLFFNKVAGLRPANLLKETLTQMFSCEFCVISKNTFLYRTPLVTPSDVNWHNNPAGNYMFKVNNRKARTMCEICSELTIKIPERRHWRRSVIFIVNFEHISHLVLVFLLLTLNMYLLAGITLTVLKTNGLPNAVTC